MRIAYQSLATFKAKANLLESLLKLEKRKHGLELLAKISGYTNYLEVTKADLSSGQLPTIDQVASQLLGARSDMASSEAHRIAEALALHKANSAQAQESKLEMAFEALYASKAKFDERALTRFTFPDEAIPMLQRPEFSPVEHAKQLREYRRPAFYLLTHKPISHNDHHDLPDWEQRFLDYPDFEAPPERFIEEWLDYLNYQLYPEHTGRHFDDEDVSETEYRELQEFLQAPSKEKASANRILSRIPGITKLAELWEPYRLQCLAQACLKNNRAQIVLMGETPVPAGTDWSDEREKIACSLAFTASSSVDWGYSMTIWEYSACFMLTNKADKRSHPIALMTGTHVVPFQKRKYPSDDAFWEAMDAHSAMLNDVWKVLNFKYFKSQGCASLRSFLRKRPGKAFTVVKLEIAPVYRGKGLAPILLNLFIGMLRDYPHSQLDAGWRQVISGRTEKPLELDADLGECGVLIFPVEGTKHEQGVRSPWELYLTRSPAEVDVPNKDPEVELRKEKLTAHFLSMQAQVEADIVVYNPWDYPMT